MKPSREEIGDVLEKAKSLAKTYRQLTCKPLGITGEVAEFSVAKLLGLELADARQSGYDAIRNENGKETRIQIKGRCLPRNAKPGQRVGSIQIDKEWDTVLLVLMDEEYNVLSIHEAERPEIERALQAPGSKARNQRGALAVTKFKAIGKQVWSPDFKKYKRDSAYVIPNAVLQRKDAAQRSEESKAYILAGGISPRFLVAPLLGMTCEGGAPRNDTWDALRVVLDKVDRNPLKMTCCYEH